MVDAQSLAQELGFEQVGAISVDDVTTSAELAAMCKPAACQKYASCWTCPPGAGTYEELQAHFKPRQSGVLVQTVQDDVDYYVEWEKLAEIRDLHHERLDKLANALRAEKKGVLEFSTGGCDVCTSCSYPDAPCLKPDEQRLSLSAHGVAVGTTCKAAGLDYSFENGRVRYVGMILFDEDDAHE
jgi:predicted metal-binding protein